MVLGGMWGGGEMVASGQMHCMDVKEGGGVFGCEWILVQARNREEVGENGERDKGDG